VLKEIELNEELPLLSTINITAFSGRGAYSSDFGSLFEFGSVAAGLAQRSNHRIPRVALKVPVGGGKTA